MPTKSMKKAKLPTAKQLLVKIGASEFCINEASWLADMRETMEELSNAYQEVEGALTAIKARLDAEGERAITKKQRRAIDEALRQFLSLNSTIRRVRRSGRLGFLHRYTGDAECVSGIFGRVEEQLES